MPVLPIYAEDIMKLFVNHTGERIKCGIKFNVKPKPFKINRINGTAISIDWIVTFKPQPECYATDIIRKNDTENRNGSTYGPFSESINLPNSDYVRIKCYSNDTNKENKYDMEEVVPLIPPKTPEGNSTQSIPNVIMIGIDSISRVNFERHFTYTKQLMSKYHFYELFGHNKVDDNTFPNIVPLLTGNHYLKFWTESKRHTMYFDNLPFIWKEFARNNFLTADVEDWSIFNFLKRGFDEVPTDYYLRPVELEIDHWILRHTYCYQDMMEMDVSFIVN